MALHLSDHFTYGRLLRFTLPSMTMMVFTSIYSVVDGFFVSNYVGKTAFAAVTLIFPLLSILGAAGFMLGAGGAAIVGKLLGEKHPRLACRSFSLFVYATLGSGVVLALLGEAVLQPVAMLLGAQGETLEQSLLYGRISLLSLPCFMLQFCFQPFFVTAEKPKLGLAVTVGAGCVNMLLDALLVMELQWGIAGAATATVVSEMLGGLMPIVYFSRPNTSLLCLESACWSVRMLMRGCSNGVSELLTNVSYPLLMALYNYQLLRFAGEDGVAAFGVLLYVSFVFSAIFLGYALGVAPLVSYAYGAKTIYELKNLFHKSMVLNLAAGFGLAAMAFVAAQPLAVVFTGYDASLCTLTTRALRLYAPVFLLCWGNIFGSSFFTALNNGIISAAIAVLRTLVFGVAAIFAMPYLLGLDGIWLAWNAAELATFAVTVSLLVWKRHAYHYV